VTVMFEVDAAVWPGVGGRLGGFTETGGGVAARGVGAGIGGSATGERAGKGAGAGAGDGAGAGAGGRTTGAGAGGGETRGGNGANTRGTGGVAGAGTEAVGAGAGRTGADATLAASFCWATWAAVLTKAPTGERAGAVSGAAGAEAACAAGASPAAVDRPLNSVINASAEMLSIVLETLLTSNFRSFSSDNNSLLSMPILRASSWMRMLIQGGRKCGSKSLRRC
jgi:hypothetical protein